MAQLQPWQILPWPRGSAAVSGLRRTVLLVMACFLAATGLFSRSPRSRYLWSMDSLARILALLRPQDLYPLWRCVDLQERMGIIPADEAVRWKRGIFGISYGSGFRASTGLPAVKQQTFHRLGSPLEPLKPQLLVRHLVLV